MKNIINRVMKNARFTALLLAVTTVFTLFTGSVYAGDLGAAYIDETVLVVKDGKVVSGDKSLVESGLVVIGDAESTDTALSPNAVTNASGVVIEDSVDESNAGEIVDVTVESDNTQSSGKQPSKDNSALLNPDSSTGVTTNTSSPSLPAKSIKAAIFTPVTNANYAANLSGVSSPAWGPNAFDVMVFLDVLDLPSKPNDNPTLSTTVNASVVGRSYATHTTMNGYKSGITTPNLKDPLFCIAATGELVLQNENGTTVYNSGRVTVEGMRFKWASGEFTDANVGNASKWVSEDLAPLFVITGGKATVYETTFQNAVSKTYSYDGAKGNGGAIRVTGGELYLYTGNQGNTKIVDCHSVNGGGLYISGGKATLENVEFSGCTATNGGAIYASGGELTLKNVSITNCSATNGGAIYVAGSATITIENTTISKNKATATNGSGGALWVGGSANVEVKGTSKLTGNSAYSQGGAIRVTGGNLTISNNTEISGNTILGKVTPTSTNIASQGQYKHGSATTFLTSQTGWTDGTVNTYQNGKLNDNAKNHGYYSSTCTVFGYTTTATSRYIYFKFSENVRVNSITLYMFDAPSSGAGFASVNYPTNITAYINGSESTSGATNLGSSTGDSGQDTLKLEGSASSAFSMYRKTFTISTSSTTEGQYVILKFDFKNYWMMCSEIQINGYFASQASTEPSYGGGMYVSGGTVNMNGGTIKDHSNIDYGGGVYVSGGNANFNGGTISNNTAVTDGGGICCYGGNVSISGATITGNGALHGGGIYVIKGATAEMSSGTISNSTNGGGVFVYNGCNFTLSGGEIKGNTQNSHSDNYQGGGVIIWNNNGGTFTMEGGEISGHSGTKGQGVGQTGNGGSIIISGGTISGNTATGNVGGGIYLNCGTLSITGGTITGNKARWGGGILAKTNAASVSISGSETVISNNEAEYNGGGVMVESGTLSISGGTISGNEVLGSGDDYGKGGGVFTTVNCTISGSTVIKSNSSLEFGGGLYVHGGTTTISAGQIGVENAANISKNGGGVAVATNNGTVIVTGTAKINYNTATTSGGGVFVGGVDTASFSMTGGEVCHNNNTGGNGGGLWIGQAKSFSMTSGTVDHNTTSKAGGGMFFNRPIITNSGITGGIITNNTAGTYGGGIYVGNFGGSLSHSVSNATISGNSAANGGGVVALEEDGKDGQVTLSLSGCTISTNTASNNGGGVYAYKTKLTIASSTIGGDSADGGNTASNRGGGVYFEKAEDSTISNSKINHNTAPNEAGGGICIDDTNVTMSGNNQVNYNVAKMYGGGIVVRAETATASLSINTGANDTGNSTINGNNISAYSGGGIHVGKSSTLNMKGGTVSDNHTTDQHGGGIDAQGIVSLDGTTVSDNTAKDSGGGISVRGSNSKLTMTNGAVFGNEATNGNGGGIFMLDLATTKEAPCTITGTEIYSNKALTDTPILTEKMYCSTSDVGMGGGIYISGQATFLKLDSATLGKKNCPNEAIYGGGASVRLGATLDAVNVNTSYNLASRSGGGYHLLSYISNNPLSGKFNTTLNITGGTISDNEATYKLNGAAVITDFTLTDGTTTGNMSSEFGGGGIYARSFSTDKPAVLIVQDVNITSNYSDNGAGGIYVHEAANATVSGCTFTNNHGKQFAGAIYFPRGQSTAAISDCIFEENHAGIRGGCMYINANGIAVSDSVMKNNYVSQLWSGHALGGAVYITSSSDSDMTDLNIPFKSVDFIGNYAQDKNNMGQAHGGAIFAENSIGNVTVTLSKSDKGEVCKFIGNYVAGNGGAIAINGSKTTLTMTGGYIVGNHAGNASIDLSESPYQKAYNATAGVGGGVAVFGGAKFTLNVNSTNKGAIYGNLAATAGDDVFTNGVSGTKATVPDISAMTKYSDALPEGVLAPELEEHVNSIDFTKDLSWYEDYMTGDGSYGNGLNGNSSYVFRYRETPMSVSASTSAISNANYVSITIGESVNNTGRITITTPSVDDPNQMFVYTISAEQLDGTKYSMTVSIAGGQTVTINSLPAGTYTVKQHTNWAWRYSFSSVTQTGAQSESVTISGDSITFYLACTSPEHTVAVSYSNNKQINHWLDFNSTPLTNKAEPVSTTVASVYSLPPKKTVIV